MTKKSNVGGEQHVSGQANKPLSRPAHALKHDDVVAEIGANALDGLTSSEAANRLTEHGRNELDQGPGVSPGKILIRQIANAMILVGTLAKTGPLQNGELTLRRS